MEKSASSPCCAPGGPSASGRLPAWATRQRLIILAVAAAVLGGLVFNWSWLTALGLAPLLLMMVPCGLMCAVGMCKKAGPQTTPADSEPPVPTVK